jgi:hypothetical protein
MPAVTQPPAAYPFVKSVVAARMLGVSYNSLLNRVRFGFIPKPQTDSSGDFIWSREDLERARVALANRSKGGRPRTRTAATR